MCFLCFFCLWGGDFNNNNNNPIPIQCCPYPYPIHTLSYPPYPYPHPIPIPPYPYTMLPAGPRLQGGTDDFFISHWEAVQFFCQCWLLGPKQKQRINWKMIGNPDEALSAPGLLEGKCLGGSYFPVLIMTIFYLRLAEQLLGDGMGLAHPTNRGNRWF